MPPHIAHILKELSHNTQAALGDNLKKIILFGSYARGDYSKDSDLDIMVLADFDESQSKQMKNHIRAISSDASLAHDITVCVMLRDANIFEARTEILPFYKNVMQDGVEIYAA